MAVLDLDGCDSGADADRLPANASLWSQVAAGVHRPSSWARAVVGHDSARVHVRGERGSGAVAAPAAGERACLALSVQQLRAGSLARGLAR
jgi:hypothetical protein